MTSASPRNSVGLAWRLDALIGDLRRALADLETMETAVRPSLARSAFAIGTFRTKLDTHLRDGLELRKQLNGGKCEISGIWRDLAKKQTAAEAALQRVHAFSRAMLSRGQGPEQEGCATAEALLDGLAAQAGLEWNGFTVVDTGESFDEVPEIITLKASLTDLWNLPVAVHELGHFMLSPRRANAPYSTLKPLFDKYLASERSKREQENRAWSSDDEARHAEHFADCFATWVSGPAYACTCLSLRFMPASEETADHPSDRDRARVVYAALQGMREWPNFSQVAEPCWNLWEKAEQDGAQPSVSEDEAQRLKTIASKCLGQLRRGVPQMEYKDWAAAIGISSLLAGDKPIRTGSLFDLVNAMWRARMLGTSREAIERQASSAAKLWLGAQENRTQKAGADGGGNS